MCIHVYVILAALTHGVYCIVVLCKKSPCFLITEQTLTGYRERSSHSINGKENEKFGVFVRST